MTKCCRSILTRVPRESLIGEAPFTNQDIPISLERCRFGLTPFSQAGMIGVL
jgi:hypothetical protein